VCVCSRFESSWFIAAARFFFIVPLLTSQPLVSVKLMHVIDFFKRNPEFEKEHAKGRMIVSMQIKGTFGLL
jgi:hypothetical protein